MQRIIGRLGLCFALLLALPLQAEQSVEWERYTIHYNAFNSTLVAPEVAARHGLTRSRYKAMLNVAVFEKDADGSMRAVPATLSGEVKNLMQQRQPLTFTAIKEGEALYYIGDFDFANEQVMHIDLTVQPESSPQAAHTIRFSQQFYTD